MIIIEKSGDITFLEYTKDVLPDKLYNKLLLEITSYNDWKSGKNNKNKDIDREQKWFHHAGEPFCKTWKNSYDRWLSHDYSPVLRETEEYVNSFVNKRIPPEVEIPNYNSILINKYKNGSCFIPRHRDNPSSFGKTPTIALISIGCPREFVIKNSNTRYSYTLGDNSLLIMAGASQQCYTHELLEDPTISDCRYSLSFREHKLE